MQISDIFYHHKKHGYDELHHLKVFLQKTWRNPVISHEKFVKNLHIQNFNKKKKKIKVKIFYFFIFKFYLTCFTTVPIFKSIGPLVAEIWGGGLKGPPNGLKSSK